MFQPGRRIGQRRGATRAPHWGQDRDPAARIEFLVAFFFCYFGIGCNAINLRGRMLRLLLHGCSPVGHAMARSRGKRPGISRCDVWSGNPVFHSSIRALSPSWDSKRCEAAPSRDEQESPDALRARLTTGSLIAQSTVDMAVLHSYAAVCVSVSVSACGCCICQYSWRIQRLATAAAATLAGLPADLSRSFNVFHFGT